MARDGTGFCGRLTPAAALGVRPAPRLTGGEEDEGEEGGAGAAAAAAVPLPPRKDRQAILRKLVSAGWLASGTGGGGAGAGGRAGRADGRASGEGSTWGTPASAAAAAAAAAPAWYGIGPRSFAELMGLLLGETDAPDARKAAWSEL